MSTAAQSDPLFEALARLREIDPEFIEAHPEVADVKVAARVKDLRRVVAAIVELQDRGEEPTAEAILEEARRLGDEFTLPAAALLELEQGFREDGDVENANTLQKALLWMAVMASRGAADS